MAKYLSPQKKQNLCYRGKGGALVLVYDICDSWRNLGSGGCEYVREGAAKSLREYAQYLTSLGYDCPLDSSPQEIYNIARKHYMSL